MKPNDRCVVFLQFFLQQRLDFFAPQFHGDHPFVPAGHAPHPLGQVEQLVVQFIGNLLFPTERLTVVQQHQFPGAGPAQHIRLHQGGPQHRRLAKRRLRIFLGRYKNILQQLPGGAWPSLPFASAIAHLADLFSGFPRPFGVRAQTARGIGVFSRKLHPEQNRLGGE